MNDIIILPANGGGNRQAIESVHEDNRLVNFPAAGERGADWQKYFDAGQALGEVYAHLAALPSSKTPEKHTARGYDRELRYFFNWAGARLPDHEAARLGSAAELLAAYPVLRMPSPALMTAYVGHLSGVKKLSATTVSKYLAVVRLWLRKLDDQFVGAVGDERDRVEDIRFQIRKAAEVKNPKPDRKVDMGELYANGHRLTLDDVQRVLLSVRDGERLADVRDYALLLTGFTSGLRVSELRRMTLNSIEQDGDGYIVTVRGKRNNYTPVALTDGAYRAILQWVAAYNGALDDGDVRRIGRETPLWQALANGACPLEEGHKGTSVDAGMSANAMRDMVKRRTGLELAPKFVKRGRKVVREVDPSWQFGPHDMRRTLAAIAVDSGMPLEAIQRQLRHQSLATTARYIGHKRDYQSQRISNYVRVG